jgi:thiamine biosynthesis protein ThiS
MGQIKNASYYACFDDFFLKIDKNSLKRLKFMKIQLNGEERDMAAATVADLIAELGLETRMLAVERNMEVVSKSAYASTKLEENDRIEIVHMIGGG